MKMLVGTALSWRRGREEERDQIKEENKKGEREDPRGGLEREVTYCHA